MTVTPKNHLVPVPVADIERLEFSGLRNSDGTLVWNGVTYEDWPEQIVIYGVVFRCEEDDDNDIYTPEGSPDGTTGSMAWYVPLTD